MHRNLRLSRLRDIGWKLWDPIGLLDGETGWEGKPFADEYDRYLINAVDQLRQGALEQGVVEYLTLIEADHMGLGAVPGMEERAWRVVKAIQAEGDLWSMPDEREG
ncbi:hypothetical protein [Ruegeria aquimaris]|uniref:Uncharacterized protein n=1 Tax=Ruegeria aquimaris TaxID=2984333 RepID=A0ABT3AI59_9RHOB|nr:hypothetical protein [Ruegeria sp. XHP0148]MCV2888335.1 hypothetical protein [Ruegeria sp. XHP0148]